VSAPVLAEEFRIRMNYQNRCTLRDVIEAATEGNAIASAVIEQAGEWLGFATASLANTFYPDLIAFAGGLAEAGDLLLSPIRKAFAYSASTFTKERVTLTRAALGSMATLNGAAYSILDHLNEAASARTP
jgi:glucokinase